MRVIVTNNLTRRAFLRSLAMLAAGGVAVAAFEPEPMRRFWPGFGPGQWKSSISIDGVKYSTLNAAIAAANAGDTIRFLR